MSVQKFLAVFAVTTVCFTAAIADGHGGKKIHIRDNLCEKSRATLKSWAQDEGAFTAYAMTITSAQAAADCYDFSSENKFYAASSRFMKYYAKRNALQTCISDSGTKGWCVVIGVVTD